MDDNKQKQDLKHKGYPRFIISGGGTGGHIFPALSIADALSKRYPTASILFIGAEGRMEMERVPQAEYEIVGLPIRGIDRSHLISNYSVPIALAKSLKLARKVIKQFDPHVVIGVGGYASGPTLEMASMMGIPTVLQEQNSYAGLTNKILARRAKTICVAYPEMEKYFPAEKIVLTGNPIRKEIEEMTPSRTDALKYFGFEPDDDRPILLAIGGSLGALTINKSVAEGLERIEKAGIRLIWQTGKNYYDNVKPLLENVNRSQFFASAFISRMDYAYSLADLLISRAGASTISEITLLGKPSILVPSPNVAEDHQTKNATALSKRNAALLVRDAEATVKLIDTAIDLIEKKEELSSISANSKLMAKTKAADSIVNEIAKLLPNE